MDNAKAPKNTSQANEVEASFWKQFAQGFREERRKGWLFRGFFRQQKQMAVSERQARFIGEAKDALANVRRLKVAPSRVETFEEAVARQGLTEEFLYGQMQRHKWIFMNTSGFMAISVLIAALAVAVNGYIHGFRAWQIENRNLVRLQDALRIPGTYLVL
jgi:hypothetical protein